MFEQRAPVLSIVVAAYNASGKLHASVDSLKRIPYELNVEVIFVDDCSTDDTHAKLARSVAENDSWRLDRLSVNSGSPSAPRNRGLDLARGEWVMFFDIDDELLLDGLDAHLAHARRTSADIVRGSLIRDDGDSSAVLNRMLDFRGVRSERIQRIIGEQSTTVPSLIRRAVLEDAGIRWREDLRMGEDTVFLASVLRECAVIEYVDVPLFIYNTAIVPGERSSTQSYGDRELRQHLKVWDAVSQTLEIEGIDYFARRGQVALQHSLTMLLMYPSEPVSESTYLLLRGFLLERRPLVESWSIRERLRVIIDTVYSGDFGAFRQGVKQRLVIAGYDLKFIRGAIPRLSETFQVAIDEWSGHDTHDVAKSERLLRWADVVHCEWLLGNAEWYSKRVAPYQKLVIRAHLFELNRDFGERVLWQAVDGLIAVSVPTLEDFVERFGIARQKVWHLPNFIEVDDYQSSDAPDRAFVLAIVGTVPSRKGLLRALSLLRELRTFDSRYQLRIYGKSAREFPWVLREDSEREYFEACESFIRTWGLTGSVIHVGWADLKSELGEVGVVLSMSDFESFHVAPAEAFAAGGVALMRQWPGVEFIYPAKYIMADEREFVDFVLSLRDAGAISEGGALGREFVREQYSAEAFIRRYRELVRSLPLGSVR